MFKSNFTLPRWVVGVIVLIPLALYFAYGFLQEQLINRPYKKVIDATLDSYSANYIKNFNQYLTELTTSIDLLSTDKNAIAALKTPQKEGSKWKNTARVLTVSNPLKTWTLRAKSSIPGANNLWLIATGGEFPLEGNFVAQRLVEQAQAGDRPPPRAGKHQGWQVYFARPVVDQDQIVGVLLVALDPASFDSAMSNGNRLQGRLRLLQTVDRFDASALLTVGTGALGNHAIRVPTSVSHWEVEFTGSRDLLSEIKPSSALFYLVYSVLCVVALVIVLTLIRNTARITSGKAQSSRKIDPKDDLFTEKFTRSRPSVSTTQSAATKEVSTTKAVSAEDSAPAPAPTPAQLPEYVFREYDIRGKAYTEITGDFAFLLGKVLGIRNLELNGSGTCPPLAVCCDGRQSSPVLKKALVSGITASGCDVLDLGAAPTPVMNFALATLDKCNSGVMVTASHNPKADNGFKIIFENRVLDSLTIKALRQEMLDIEDSGNAEVSGTIENFDIQQSYISKLSDDVLPTELKVAIDCGNGIAGVVAPPLFRQLGCEVYELFTQVDGSFPNHEPDPTVPENLSALIAMVKENKLDAGLAFDGDGDRVVAVTASGRIVWPDELLMIFARDIVTRLPGSDIVFDVKSSRRLRDLITTYGGRPVMWKTGHANIRSKVKESGAPVGGEFSGHIFFNDRWFGFDDGIYAAARLLEIMSLREQSLDDIIAGFPEAHSTPEIKIAVPESEKMAMVDRIKKEAVFGDAHLVDIDGIRIEYPDGWGLIRASNTSAALTLRFESETPEGLEAIQDAVRQQIEIIFPDLSITF